MSEALARVEFTPDQVDLIKRTICNGLSNDEFNLFLGQCRRTGLDPFSKQIHAVKRGGKLSIQVGIDGFRLVAERTGQTDGQDGPYWCGTDGIWKDVWLEKAAPAAAKVTVYRKGQSRGYTGVARWAEFYQPSGGMWDRLPATMLAKVAETIALRKGFPQELSGVYSPEEMDQAGAAEVPHVNGSIAHTPTGNAPRHDPATLEMELGTALHNAPTLADLAAAWVKVVEAVKAKSFDSAALVRLTEEKERKKAELSKPAREPGEDESDIPV